MKIVLVIAGNRLQFQSYITDKIKSANSYLEKSMGDPIIDGVKYIYVSNARKMMGWHGVEVEFVDGWSMRDDSSELQKLAKIARIK